MHVKSSTSKPTLHQFELEFRIFCQKSFVRHLGFHAGSMTQNSWQPFFELFIFMFEVPQEMANATEPSYWWGISSYHAILCYFRNCIPDYSYFLDEVLCTGINCLRSLAKGHACLNSAVSMKAKCPISLYQYKFYISELCAVWKFFRNVMRCK